MHRSDQPVRAAARAGGRELLLRHLVAAAALLVGATALAGPFEGPELVTNGNFSGGLSGWTEESHSNFTSNWSGYGNFGEAPSGMLVGEGKSGDPPDEHPVAWQCASVLPGHTYRLRGAIRTPDGEESAAHAEAGAIRLYPASTAGCSEDGAPLLSLPLIVWGVDDQLWQPKEGTVTIPAGVTRVQVAAITDRGEFVHEGNINEYTAHNYVDFDAISLRELRGDLALSFGSGLPAEAIPGSTHSFPLVLRNVSDYQALTGEVTLTHGGRLQLVSASCSTGNVVDVSQGDHHFFRWFGIPDMAPHTQHDCELEVKVREGFAGTVNLRAVAHAENDHDGANGIALHTLHVPAVPNVGIALEVTEFPQVGQTVQAELMLRNTGTAGSSSGLELRWLDDAGAVVTLPGFDDGCGGFAYEGGLALAVVDLAAGAQRSCTLSFTWPTTQASDLTASIVALTVQDYDTTDNEASAVAKLLRLRVNNPDDHPDWNPGDGICENINGQFPRQCSLRAAVMEANAIAGTQTIEVPVLSSPYVLDRGEDAGSNYGAIEITARTILAGEPLPDGSRPRLVLDFPVDEPGRAFHISGGSYTRLQNLDIEGQGLPYPGDGGLIEHTSGKLVLRDARLANGRALGKGGAIHSTGDLTLERVDVLDNVASIGGGLAYEPTADLFLLITDSRFSGNGGAATDNGGGVYMTHALAGIDGSTFDDNRADRGGALYADAGNFAVLASNSTFSGNVADLEGGAIWTASAVALGYATIADNVAAPGDDDVGLGGGVYVSGAADVNSYATIWNNNTAQLRVPPGAPPGLAYPHAALCWGVVDGAGFNHVQSVSQDQLCSFVATADDAIDVIVTLAPLADNGGPTPTRAPQTGGVIDAAADDCAASAGGDPLEVDQRGFPRPADGDGDGQPRCDKGAYERTDAARITVAKSGSGTGRVNSTPSGIFCGTTCTSAFEAGASVTLTAFPDPFQRFVGWGGACSGSAQTCTVTATGEVVVQAVFEPANSRALTVALLGHGAGTVDSMPSGIDCPGDCDATYEDGATVTLQAQAAVGSTFTGWSGGYCSGTADCTLTMDGARHVEARFVADTHTLSVGLDGDGSGHVTGVGGTIDCPSACVADLVVGTPITLTATPAADSTFERWIGGACDGSTSSTCSFDLDADVDSAARFVTLADPVLHVEITGAGTLTSQPVGIDCGSQCDAAFTRGSTVTLIAAADAGHELVRWRNGPCAGSDAASCTLTLDVTTVVRAEFGPQGGAGTVIFADGFED